MPDFNQKLQNRLDIRNIRQDWEIAFQSLIFLLCIIGVTILILESKTIHDALNLFSYYTVQSNLFVAAAMALSIWGLLKGQEDSSLLVIFKSGSMLWILVTGIVYHLMLSNLWHPQGLMAFASLALHYCAPIGMLLNWLIFEKKGKYKLTFAVYWLSYPFLYSIGTWLRGWLTDFYPYWFLNPTQPYPKGTGSMGTMLVIVGVLCLGFYSLGLLIILLDKLLAHRLQDRRCPRS